MNVDEAKKRDENSEDLGAGYLDIIAGRAAGYIRQSRAHNTLKGYKSDWSQFENWCQKHGKMFLPATAESVMLYLSHLAENHRPATLTRHLASISQNHQIAGYETPTRTAKVRLVMAGIRRMKGTAQDGKMPVLVEDLRNMIARMPDGLIGVRDRALLLIGFSGAFRRSELVGFDVKNVEFVRDGMVMTMRRSKTDQQGEGRKVGIPLGHNVETCAVRAFRAWMQMSAITTGPIFRPVTRHGKVLARRLSTNAVAKIVKRHAEAIGLDATQFAGHSLRSGLATAAALAGKTEREIMRQTGHHSEAMVRKYIRDATLFKDNVASSLGL